MFAHSSNYAYIVERNDKSKEQKPISQERIEQAKKNIEKYLTPKERAKINDYSKAQGSALS